jgi:hypothetical protein
MLQHPYFKAQSSAAPLAVFRFALGVMLLLSVIRFWSNGWIEDLYIKPLFYFSFYGFEFVKPLGEYSYLLFAVCGFSSLMVALGWYYRSFIVLLFLSFTYIELIDKSTYLNHYYFISLICFLMVFLPAHVCFSVDSYRNKFLASAFVPRWTIDSIKLMVCILYFYAGVAKINTDWLMEALPLKIWLPARNDMPVIGGLFNYAATAYVFSWIGCIYDLSIPFLLWNKISRPFAYLAVVVFHVLTSVLFPIGMFPYIMMVTALIFFSADFHFKLIELIEVKLLKQAKTVVNEVCYQFNPLVEKFVKLIFILFFMVQLLLPFRYLLYPGKLFWTEQGFRFSWRVMLIEKAGLAEFKVIAQNGKVILVNNRDFLTPLQEKMMSTQPDMILQFAHFLASFYQQQGVLNPKVFVDSYVSLNGEMGKPLVDPNVDLAKEKESLLHKHWIKLYSIQ